MGARPRHLGNSGDRRPARPGSGRALTPDLEPTQCAVEGSRAEDHEERNKDDEHAEVRDHEKQPLM